MNVKAGMETQYWTPVSFTLHLIFTSRTGLFPSAVDTLGYLGKYCSLVSLCYSLFPLLVRLTPLHRRLQESLNLHCLSLSLPCCPLHRPTFPIAVEFVGQDFTLFSSFIFYSLFVLVPALATLPEFFYVV